MLKRLLAPGLLLLATASLADTGVVSRKTQLMAEPYSDATAVVQLVPNTQVELLERRGGWYRARAGQREGWLRLASVRLQEQSDAAGDKGLGRSLRFARTGRSGAHGSQATTGIRGLDQKALAGAQPNRAALATMAGHAVSADEAAAFARKHKLEPRP